jgi:hypothetical protein
MNTLNLRCLVLCLNISIPNNTPIAPPAMAMRKILLSGILYLPA